jgi:hypothetical protein
MAPGLLAALLTDGYNFRRLLAQIGLRGCANPKSGRPQKRRGALAGNGRSTDVQMIDSTHVKAHRSAAGEKGGR